jgi:hypothetical protein
MALRAAKTALCASTGYFWWGLGEDTKEVKERGRAFDPWSRFERSMETVGQYLELECAVWRSRKAVLSERERVARSS